MSAPCCQDSGPDPRIGWTIWTIHAVDTIYSFCRCYAAHGYSEQSTAAAAVVVDFRVPGSACSPGVWCDRCSGSRGGKQCAVWSFDPAITAVDNGDSIVARTVVGRSAEPRRHRSHRQSPAGCRARPVARRAGERSRTYGISFTIVADQGG